MVGGITMEKYKNIYRCIDAIGDRVSDETPYNTFLYYQNAIQKIQSTKMSIDRETRNKIIEELLVGNSIEHLLPDDTTEVTLLTIQVDAMILLGYCILKMSKMENLLTVKYMHFEEDFDNNLKWFRELEKEDGWNQK
jgi:hypothetical protein